MIPRIIHQFNIENSDESKIKIDKIRNENKKFWRHNLWKLEEVKTLYPYAKENFKQKFEFFLENKMYKKAEDIAKFLILKVHGGLYIDEGFALLKGKKINDIPFEDNDLALFNGIHRRDDSYRFQETIIGSSENHRFINHLLDYIGQTEYMPRCPFDGKVLDIYSAGYITNHYLLYNRLCNNLPVHGHSVARILGKNIKLLDKEYVFAPKYFFHLNKSMILKHNTISKRLE